MTVVVTPLAGQPIDQANVAITGGTIKVNDGSAAAPSYSFSSNTNTGFYTRANFLMAAVQGVEVAFFSNSTINSFTASYGVGLAGGSTLTEPADVFLTRDAANILAQRNGTAAQAFRLYNTFTGASNYERGAFDWTTNANTLTIGTAAAGTGTNRDVRITSASTLIKIEGNLWPLSTGAYTLGAGSLGWKQIFIDYTNTATVGAVTINKAAGRVNIAAAGTSVVVTNSLVTAATKVFAVISQNDGTAVLKNVVPAAGSFTITLNAATTAQVSIDFFIVNAD